MQTNREPVYANPIQVAKIPKRGEHITHIAEEAELRELCTHLGLIAVERFDYQLTLRPMPGHYMLHGTLMARYLQSCAMSLEPVLCEIKEPVQTKFFNHTSKSTNREQIDFDQSDFDFIENGTIDCGSLCMEYLALSIDPYLKKNDGTYEPVNGTNFVSRGPSPFSELQNLKSE